MKIDRELLRDIEIFNPGIIDLYEKIADENSNLNFAHYTSAETAFKIIKNQEVWFRNVSMLNDFSEVQYGMKFLKEYFMSDDGAKFISILNTISPETFDKISKRIGISEMHWRFETYIACLSLHDSNNEDINGRLSMWRAYGDTAIVINENPLMKFTDAIKVFSFPVSYFTKSQFFGHLSNVLKSIEANQVYLRSIHPDRLNELISSLFFRLCIGVKHPGFEEEKEWRVYYQPTMFPENPSKVMKEELECIGGIPQKIYKLQLMSSDDPELDVIDFRNDLHKIIIGPTSYPGMIAKVFHQQLKHINVENSETKISISDIPLRI